MPCEVNSRPLPAGCSVGKILTAATASDLPAVILGSADRLDSATDKLLTRSDYIDAAFCGD